jgi:hypothetical protein
MSSDERVVVKGAGFIYPKSGIFSQTDDGNSFNRQMGFMHQYSFEDN